MSFSNALHTHMLTYDDIYHMINNQHFWVEYEPIIDMQKGDVFGYEALARFIFAGSHLAPALVLNIAHEKKELFFHLEQALKIMQLAYRPQEGMLFVNIDPHNFSDSDKILYWHTLFRDIKNLCIEVTENTDDMQTLLLSHCLDEIQKTGIPIAQDDIGNDEKPFCFDLTRRAEYLKFDRSWLTKIKACENFQEILKGFLSFAKAQNKKSILEGIESEEDLAIAESLGVDFVQGYMFKHLNRTSNMIL